MRFNIRTENETDNLLSEICVTPNRKEYNLGILKVKKGQIMQENNNRN